MFCTRMHNFCSNGKTFTGYVERVARCPYIKYFKQSDDIKFFTQISLEVLIYLYVNNSRCSTMITTCLSTIKNIEVVLYNIYKNLALA